MVTKTRKDVSATKDVAKNKRSEEYNRAVVTVRQNQKEKELSQGLMSQMLLQQQIETSKQALMDLVAKIDLQQRILENKMKVMDQSMQQQASPTIQAPADLMNILSGSAAALGPSQPPGMPPGAGGGQPDAQGVGGQGIPPGMPPGMPPGAGGGQPDAQGGGGGVFMPQPPVM